MLFGCVGCVTSSTSVTRQLLAPLPAMPMTVFDREHQAQVSLGGQAHPFPLREVRSASVVQGEVGPMVRVGRRVALGGVFELVAPFGARYTQSFLHPQSLAAYGMRVGVQVGLVDTAVFGLEAAVQVSAHLMPATISQTAPLTPTSTLATTQTLLPGISAALLPRANTRFGTFFAGVSAATQADIAAVGPRNTLSDGSTSDDLGHLASAPVFMVGVGYSNQFDSGLGVKLQVWLPVTNEPVAYNVMAGLTLSFGFGQFIEAPRARRLPPVSPPPLVPAPEPAVIPQL
jgi:hypothetical protein